jgi:hypothetical protein
MKTGINKLVLRALLCAKHRQMYSFCRSVGMALSISLFCNLAVSAKPISEVSPTRAWKGSEYAESVYSLYLAEKDRPQLSLDFEDLSALGELGKEAGGLVDVLKETNHTFRHSEEKGFKAKIVNSMKEVFPERLEKLLEILETGNPIPVEGSSERLEAQLRNWILDQPEKSIYPHQLMVEALKISEGKVFLAWAVAWNLMRKDWPAAPTRNYGELTNRFASLTGERHLWQGAARYIVVNPEDVVLGPARIGFSNGDIKEVQSKRYLKLVVSKRGDEFSYLYHRIGIELFSMVISKYYGSDILGRLAGSAGALGEWFKYTKTAGLATENKKRVYNDLAAAESGQKLFKLFQLGNQGPTSRAALNPRHYLRSDRFSYGQRYQLKGRPAAYFGAKVDPQYWALIMSVKELKLRFFHALNYDEGVFDPVILASTGESDRLHAGLEEYAKSGANDLELNQMLKDYQSGVRAAPVEPDVVQDLNLRPFKNEEFVQSLDPEFRFSNFQYKLNQQIVRVLGFVEQKKMTCQRVFFQ